MNKIMHKTFHFKATNVMTEERNGIPVGILKGYASTWGIDRGNDQIMKGAFIKSIMRHKSDNRQIRMYDGHDTSKLIGGYPIDKVVETDLGLYVEGEVNLQVQRGGEVYALVKQGVLSDFSIGFNVPNKNSIKTIKIDGKSVTQYSEIELWEISPVSEPMNKDAQIMAVKGNFGDLPLAERSYEWNPDEALMRVKEFGENEKAFCGEFLIADVVDGQLVAIPKAIFSVASAFNLKALDDESGVVESYINSYYAKMNLESPLGKGIDVTIVESCNGLKDVEQLLKHLGVSGAGSKALISKVKSLHCDGDVVSADENLQKKGSVLELVAQGYLLTHKTK